MTSSASSGAKDFSFSSSSPVNSDECSGWLVLAWDSSALACDGDNGGTCCALSRIGWITVQSLLSTASLYSCSEINPDSRAGVRIESISLLQFSGFFIGLFISFLQRL